MATKLMAAQKRLFHNVFVCRNCNKKIRSNPVKILAGQIKCSKCGRGAFRPIRKK